MTVTHPLPPIYDAHSRVLILGTMPSPRSRAEGFYYAHPQNRFWRVLGQVLGRPFPPDNAGRIRLLLASGIALWDVLAQCQIDGAQDASIRAPVANDLSLILQAAPIRAIFTTGKTAEKWYQKLLLPQTGMPAILLPSSSPANCAVPMEKMVESYSRILDYL